MLNMCLDAVVQQLLSFANICRGKSKGRISQTPWGIPTKGYRTRKNVRTDKFVRLARR